MSAFAWAWVIAWSLICVAVAVPVIVRAVRVRRPVAYVDVVRDELLRQASERRSWL